MLRRNVLIFHSGALGDFVLTWPIALALSRIFPQSRVMYVTAGEKGKLAERTLRVESVDVEGGWHWLYSDSQVAPPANVERLLQSTHTALIFSANTDGPAADKLRISQPTVKVVTLSTKTESAVSYVQSLLSQLDNWPVLQQAAISLLAGIAGRGLAVNHQPECDVVIHPGSGGEHKRWPVECFVSLAKRIAKAGPSVRFVIGEVERERWSKEHLAALESVTEVRQPESLVKLLDELIAAKIVVGNDSGPGHLAAIVGVPTLSLFGPTDPAIWSPIGPSVTVLRSRPIDTLSIDTVFDALGFG